MPQCVTNFLNFLHSRDVFYFSKPEDGALCLDGLPYSLSVRIKTETTLCCEMFIGKGFFLSQEAGKSLNIIREVKMTPIVYKLKFLNYTNMDTSNTPH